MTNAARTETLRIFPLAQVVLFPDATIPLYIFEPRYRAMTSDALADDRLIGMVTVLPQHTDAMSDDPPIFDVGCAGRIVRAEARADGTYAIVLEARQRFRIVSEPPRQHPYRVAQVEYLDEESSAERREVITRQRSEIRAALEHLTAPIPSDREDEDAAASGFAQLDALDDDRFVNTLAQTLDFDVLEKQRLLECSGVANRYDVMLDLMRFRLAAIDAPIGPTKGLVH